jgi:hypothetical protein
MSEGLIFVLIGGGMLLFFLLLFIGAIFLHRRKTASRAGELRDLTRKHGLTYIGNDDSLLASYQHLRTFQDDGFASWVNDLLSGEMGEARVHLFDATYSTAGGGSSGRFVHYTMCIIEHYDLGQFKVSGRHDDRRMDALDENSEQNHHVQQVLRDWNQTHRTKLRYELEKGVLLLSIRKRLSTPQCAELLGLAQRILNDLT